MAKRRRTDNTMAKRKRRNNDLQHTTEKQLEQVTRTVLSTGGTYSTSVTRRVTIVTTYIFQEAE